MKFKNMLLGGAALAAISFAMGLANDARASLIGTFKGNDCAGVFGIPFSTCSYNGSPIIIKFDADGTAEVNTAVFPSVTGAEFIITGLTGSSGTWTYNPGPNDPLITVFAAKAGNEFNLFANDGDPNSGTWFTPGGRGLSHISFYDTAAPPVSVPEPAGLMVLGGAMLGLFAVRRRRRAA